MQSKLLRIGQISEQPSNQLGVDRDMGMYEEQLLKRLAEMMEETSSGRVRIRKGSNEEYEDLLREIFDYVEEV